MFARIFLTVWFVLAATSLAHAGALFGLVGLLTSTSIGKLVLGVALKVGASLLQKVLAKGNQKQPSGVKGTIEVGGVKPRSFIVGTYATPGHLVYANTWGQVNKTPNAGFCQVISVSNLPVNSISNDVWVGGAKVVRQQGLEHPASHAWFGTGSYAFPSYERDGYYFLFAKYYPGGATVPDSKMRSVFGGDGLRPWTADMVGRGDAHVILTAEFKRDLFKGFPEARFVVEGIKLYDPRKDSTVGGSGSQRWGDETTYAFTDNPAVIIYNILRGIYYNGEKVYGGNVPAARLPLSSWFAAMNECDVIVDGQRQFRCGYEIEVDQQPLNVIEELLKSCNGRMAEIGGVYKIHVGAPALPAYFFTDESVVISEEQSFDPFPGLENTFNGVSASYPEPDAAWEMKDAPVRYSTDYIAADDGRENFADVTFAAVPYAIQVQRLQKALLEENRRFRRHRHTLPPEAWLLEPLDTVSWTSERNGYTNKLFLISAMDDLENVNQAVSIQEVDPSDYNWTPGTDELPYTVGPVSPIEPAPQPMVDWHAEPASVDDANGIQRRPAILLSWDGDQVDVQAVEFEVRLATTLEVVYRGRSDQPAIGSILITQGLLPNTDYQVRGRYIPYSNRQTLWSGWLAVTTWDVRLSIYYDIDLDGINELVNDATDWVGWNTREEIERARHNILLDIEQDAANYLDKQSLRSELAATTGNMSARWSEDITLLLGGQTALAQRLEVLEVTVEEDIAEAVDLLTTQIENVDGRVTANATAITALTATVDDVSAEANFRMEVTAGTGGYASRIGAQARVGGSGNWRSASWFLDVPADDNDPTRFAVVADQFVVTDGTTDATPFVVKSGTVYAENIRLGTLNFDQLSSNNGKLLLKGSGSNASIEIFN